MLKKQTNKDSPQAVVRPFSKCVEKNTLKQYNDVLENLYLAFVTGTWKYLSTLQYVCTVVA